MPDLKTRAYSPTSTVYHVGMQPGHPPHRFTMCGLYTINLARGTPDEVKPRKLCKTCQRLWGMNDEQSGESPERTRENDL